METINEKNEPVRIQLPNSNAILLLGIFSIVTSFCCSFFALIGLVLGIVALSMAPRAVELYQANPSMYTENSYKNISAGRVCAIIGIVVSGLIMLAGIIWFAIVGGVIGTIFDKIPWDNFLN